MEVFQQTACRLARGAFSSLQYLTFFPSESVFSGVHGRGVYATEFISRGTCITEYTGQRVSWKDALNDENNPRTFIFGLESGKVINPEIGGNEARWINHCCDPNCQVIEEDNRIFIYAMRDIEPGRNSLTIALWNSTNRLRRS